VTLWRPTLQEAGESVAELVNQIGASCPVDIEPFMATNGTGPEGPVYAFTVSWGCAGADASSTPLPAQAAVVARDIAFEPGQLNVPASTELTLTVTNEDPTPHNFSIDELQFSEDILPGATASISGTVPPGTYEFYCNVPGHRELGMVGIIIAE
jgi:plastocyanin